METTEGLVLVVDDNDSNRYVKSQTIRRAGFSVIEAATGQLALELVRRHPVDVVLLDVNLPDMSGIDVCGRLKADDDLAAVPVLQTSATAVTDEDKVRGLSGGADAYLVEPVNPDVMVATLRALLRVRRAERDLAAALEREREGREMAERANQTKDDFLATLSHELRTPLNAMLGWISQLRSGALDESRRAHAVEAIERSARLQWRLVEELLDVASIRAQKLHLEMSTVDLQAIGATAIEFVRRDATRRRVTIETTTEPVQVVGDPARLHQVITNLLSNATQFTPAGGRIMLTIAQENGGAMIRVDDTGIGIEPEFLPYVFDEFRQAERVKKDHGGLGLGLAISRHIVELHGGRISAQSDGLGRGATFTVRIPLATPR